MKRAGSTPVGKEIGLGKFDQPPMTSNPNTGDGGSGQQMKNWTKKAANSTEIYYY